MQDLTRLQKEIEKVRQHLHEMVVIKDGNLSDTEVSQLSITLDKLILRYQQVIAKNKGIGK